MGRGTMRNNLAAVVIAAAILLTPGCGGDDGGGPTPGETVGGGPVAEGRMVFLDQGCGSCHALGAADTHGTVGPNLAVGLAGKTKQFIRESIVDPNASVRS